VNNVNLVKSLSGAKESVLKQLEKNWFEEDFILQVNDTTLDETMSVVTI